MATSRALTIRFASDVDSARRGMAQLATQVAANMATIHSAAEKGTRATLMLATAINTVSGAATRMRGLGLPVITAWIAGFMAVSSAIGTVRSQLAEMLELAERAGKVGVSPEFLQAFASISKSAKAAGTDIEAALGRAFEATKETWGESNPILKALMEIENFLSRGVSSQFFAAATQDEKIRLVLDTMRQLEASGQRLAAIDLAEKMFGAKFADQIRLGKLAIDEIAKTVETKLAHGVRDGDFVSNDTVRRAEELDRRLKDAWETTSQNLKPAWDGLAEAALIIKGIWVEIVELLEKASRFAHIFGPAAERARLQGELADIRGKLDRNDGILGGLLPLTDSGRTQLQRRASEIEQRLGRDTYGTEFSAAPPYPPLPQFPTGAVPMPRSDPRKAEEESARQLDHIDRFISSMERSNEVLEAELKTLGLSNVEREKAVALARAGHAARQAGREMTEEERANVIRLAEAHARLAETMQRVRNIQAEIKEFGSALGDAFKSAVLEGEKLDKVLANLAKRMASRGIDKLFDLAFGFLAKAVGGALVGGTGSDRLGFASPVQRMATGGVIPPGGLAYVGEHGPNPRFIRAGSAPITVTPADVGRRSGAFAPVFHVNAAGADPAAIMRLERALAQTVRDLRMTQHSMASAQHAQSTGVALGGGR